MKRKIKFEDADRIGICKRKIKVADRNNRAVACHNFWKEAPEDILLEIFTRLPDCRSAARTSTVCREWHSLISRNRQFIDLFKSQHHHQRPVIPWTIMFRKTDFYDYGRIPEPQHLRNNCQVDSEEWVFLHGKSPDNCLDFLPTPMLIRAASCNDLLLVSPGLSYTDDLYICSPVTKQFVQLPAIPRLEDPDFYEDGKIGYALVPSGGQFKVVEVLHPGDYRSFGELQVSVFCSESRKWEIRHFLGPRQKISWSAWLRRSYYSNIIRCNEILYWLGTSEESGRIGYLDLSKEKCGAIDVPSRDQYEIGVVHLSGGVQELRLIQLIYMPKRKMVVHLKVWRLNHNDDDDSGWCLVHDKKFKRPRNASKGLVGTFVHPTDGDLVFLVWGKTVVEYNLIDETYKKIAELQADIDDWFTLSPFLMVHS